MISFAFKIRQRISLMRKVQIIIYLFSFVILCVPFLSAQYFHTMTDPLLYDNFKDSIPPLSGDTLAPQSDTLIVQKDSLDSLPSDSVLKKTIQIPSKKSTLDNVVDYSAKDSIVLTGNNWGYLYGDAEIKYTDIGIKGEQISMNMDSSLVYATYGLDSLGNEFGYPLFTDKSGDYEMKSVKYKFDTRKGYITNVITQQGEGYVVAKQAKKADDESFFIKDGQYTTCDDHDHPHFYFALTKGKVRPGKDVVTGPAYLVIEGLPLPLGIPFGFFPFTDKYSSGVIMPSFGDDLERGFNLRDGGYYFAISDYMDLALTGEIFTKGSWGINASSSYKKRYKYSGSFNAGYLVTKLGDKGAADYSLSKDFRINWTHTQDPKANMYRTLSASVNFSTTSYNRNELNTMYNSNLYTQSIKSSTVNVTQRFPNSPWSISGSMTINQNSLDSSVSLTLPNMSISMSQLSPFKRKKAVGAEQWYEKIRISYSGEFKNSITTKENLLLKSKFPQDWQNGMKHNIPVSATFNVFNYFNITPSANYTEIWDTRKIYYKPDASGRIMPSDTINEFGRVYYFNASISLQTKVYGFFKPVFAKKTTIRHVFTPDISFSARPDFSDSKYGFYESFKYIDANGLEQTYTYSPYANGLFGTAPRGKQGAINFNFQNNLEMKTPSQSDSTGFKKISLIENLSIGFSNNIMADSLNWSDISTSVRFKFTKTMPAININATWDPYTYAINESGNPVKINKLRVNEGKGLARLKSTGYSLSPSINQDTFKKWFGKDKSSSEDKSKSVSDPSLAEDGLLTEDSEERKSLLESKKDTGDYDSDGYLNNQVRWNLGLTFSMNYNYASFNKEKLEYNGEWSKNLSFYGSIQPSKSWNFTFNGSYDFTAKKIPYMSCTVSRDLHCWTLSANFIPIGPRTSYYFSIKANASMLQDLKQEKKGSASSYDPNWD